MVTKRSNRKQGIFTKKIYKGGVSKSLPSQNISINSISSLSSDDSKNSINNTLSDDEKSLNLFLGQTSLVLVKICWLLFHS